MIEYRIVKAPPLQRELTNGRTKVTLLEARNKKEQVLAGTRNVDRNYFYIRYISEYLGPSDELDGNGRSAEIPELKEVASFDGYSPLPISNQISGSTWNLDVFPESNTIKRNWIDPSKVQINEERFDDKMLEPGIHSITVFVGYDGEKTGFRYDDVSIP